jgi:hypothetical protein
MEAGERSAAQPPSIGRDVAIAGISTLGSIAVALIAILPHLRNPDLEQIAKLKTQVQSGQATGDRLAALQAQMAVLCQAYGCEEHGKPWTVHGSIRPTQPGSKVAEYQVYLVPEKQVQTTGDDGRFVFEDVPPGSYSIVARAPGGEPSSTVRGAVNRYEPGDTLLLRGARIDYRVLGPQRASGAPELGGYPALVSAAGP